MYSFDDKSLYAVFGTVVMYETLAKQLKRLFRNVIHVEDEDAR